MRIIYTDGACSGNPGSGGCAMLELSTKDGFPYLQHADCIYYQNTTNNRMELEAMINAFKYIQKIKTDDEFEIYSDSAYVVNMCNDWIWKWAAAGWVRAKNKPIENLDLVKQLYELLNFNNIKYTIKKCNGHAGMLGNELADALASDNNLKYKRLVKTYNIIT
jgi:ribonuclease HI